jgi:hypothetical protein
MYRRPEWANQMQMQDEAWWVDTATAAQWAGESNGHRGRHEVPPSVEV